MMSQWCPMANEQGKRKSNKNVQTGHESCKQDRSWQLCFTSHASQLKWQNLCASQFLNHAIYQETSFVTRPDLTHLTQLWGICRILMDPDGSWWSCMSCTGSTMFGPSWPLVVPLCLWPATAGEEGWGRGEDLPADHITHILQHNYFWKYVKTIIIFIILHCLHELSTRCAESESMENSARRLEVGPVWLDARWA